MKTSSLILLLVFPVVICSPLNCQNSQNTPLPTATQVIDKIIKNTGSQLVPNTVDIIKEGNPETPVTGIVTSMFATMDVLKRAVQMNCNMIIVHEPLYYNHLDNTTQFKNDPVFQEKKKFINDNKLVIWRFHDYIHRIKPDGIQAGMVKKLGWNEYAINSDLNSFEIPETTLEDLLGNLKQKFSKNAFHVIGKPEMKVRRVKLIPGAPGSMAHINALAGNSIDLVIGGEVPQWETYEYMRDAVSQGRKKAIIFLGHVASEEAGMSYCAEWLKGFMGNLPISFVESGPSYWSY